MFSSEPLSPVTTFDLFYNIQGLSELDEFWDVEWTKNLSVFMFAQTCLESGNGERLRGFNVGNIIWTKECGLPYYEVSGFLLRTRTQFDSVSTRRSEMGRTHT